ncbi:MAG: hypothetical protein ACT4QF_02045 [Sporichthyaceae bacterium]
MRTLSLGVAGVAGALLASSLLPSTATAAPVAESGASVAAGFNDDLGVQWVTVPATATVGQAVRFRARVSTVGADAVDRVSFTISLPPTFGYAEHEDLGPGWTPCTAPEVGNTGHIVCKHQGDFSGSAELVFDAIPLAPGSATVSATVTDTGNKDTNEANDTASRTITATPPPVPPAPPSTNEDLDPGYPAGWFSAGGYGGGYGDDYDDYYDCDYDCF